MPPRGTEPPRSLLPAPPAYTQAPHSSHFLFPLQLSSRSHRVPLRGPGLWSLLKHFMEKKVLWPLPGFTQTQCLWVGGPTEEGQYVFLPPSLFYNVKHGWAAVYLTFIPAAFLITEISPRFCFLLLPFWGPWVSSYHFLWLRCLSGELGESALKSLLKCCFKWELEKPDSTEWGETTLLHLPPPVTGRIGYQWWVWVKTLCTNNMGLVYAVPLRRASTMKTL